MSIKWSAVSRSVDSILVTFIDSLTIS